jgi:hypothetical protein
MKTLCDKQKLKEFINRKPALQETPQWILRTEEDNKCNQENKAKNKSL